MSTRGDGLEPSASLRQVRKAYGATRVLTGVDLDIPAGGVTVLLGASGCGKTTLLRLLAGFDRADSGAVRLTGTVVDGPAAFVAARHRHVGYVPQEGALFTHLTVAANVGFGVPRAQRRPRTSQMLELVGLSAFARRRPSELSGGQQQRVALARALAINPRLVLLDEPFSALDPGLRTQLRADVLDLLRTTGTTALLVTHDQEEAFSAADQVGLLDQGRLAQIGPPEQVFTSPATAAIARFLGVGTLLPATLIGDGWVQSSLGRLPLIRDHLHGRSGPRPGTVLVRSDQLRLRAPTATVDGAVSSAPVPGRVTGREYHGHHAVLKVLLQPLADPLDGAFASDREASSAARDVTLRCSGTDAPQLGAAVTVSVTGPVVFYDDEADSPVS